jgi:hypothetical protein
MLLFSLRMEIQWEIWAYPITEIIGKRLAKAINPKPSRAGSRPGTVSDSPRPRAATSGTVTVDVVTPPESYARAIIFLGVVKVWRTTTRYPARIYI